MQLDAEAVTKARAEDAAHMSDLAGLADQLRAQRNALLRLVLRDRSPEARALVRAVRASKI